MEITIHPDQTAAQIKANFPQYHPRVGMILSSGLNDFIDHLEDRVTIPYQSLPGFPMTSVHGHLGNMILGRFSGQDIVCLQGRAHNYENTDTSHQAVKMYVRTLQRLGCEYFIATNVVGSLNPEVKPGELMILEMDERYTPTVKKIVNQVKREKSTSDIIIQRAKRKGYGKEDTIPNRDAAEIALKSCRNMLKEIDETRKNIEDLE